MICVSGILLDFYFYISISIYIVLLFSIFTLLGCLIYFSEYFHILHPYLILIFFQNHLKAFLSCIFYSIFIHDFIFKLSFLLSPFLKKILVLISSFWNMNGSKIFVRLNILFIYWSLFIQKLNLLRKLFFNCVITLFLIIFRFLDFDLT